MKQIEVVSLFSTMIIVGTAYGLLNTTSASPVPSTSEYALDTSSTKSTYPRIVQVTTASELEQRQANEPESNVDTIETKSIVIQDDIEKEGEEKQIAPSNTKASREIDKNQTVAKEHDFSVPFYSQFNDISDPNWKKSGCGIASLAMIVEHYEPGKVSVDSLLQEGIKSGAYLNNAGWIHSGLIKLSSNYGLTGSTKDVSNLGAEGAFLELKKVLEEGPVMASVHYTFDPQNPIPHLVVVNGVDGNTVYYNDPAEKAGGGTITSEKFIKAWKKRYIEFHPA